MSTFNSPDTSNLKALAVSANANAGLYEQASINPSLLERFKKPSREGAPVDYTWVHIVAPEFTSLCPLTGQPDFATIEILYRPGAWCVESKSLKLYLGSFRNVGDFHESVAVRIALDLSSLLDIGRDEKYLSSWLLVRGIFTPRGGIAFRPRAAIGPVPLEVLLATSK